MHSIETKRHSLAHIMAYAVQRLYPEAKFGVGPALENGFYYDIGLDIPLKPEDLLKIENVMRKTIKEDAKFEKEVLEINQAIALFKKLKQDYKVELLNDLKKKGTTKVNPEELSDINPDDKKEATVYKTGKFIDLCRGPHVNSSSDLKGMGFALDKIAGAYWRGDEKNPMLTRIYGLAFETKNELSDYVNAREEAKKRDHRILGEMLDLFVFSDLVGPGLPLYTFKGAAILKEIKNYTNELQKQIGYQEVQTPNMNRAELFKVSGHYEKYKDDMFKVISHYSKEDYYLKPMNCPQHTQIYASRPRSYKDLPIRIADFAQLYRDEKTGELSGLARLRGFSQDDGHSFCTEPQIKTEFTAILSIVEKAMKTYGMDYKIRLSLCDPKNPDKYLGEAKTWKKSQQILEEILIKNNVEYYIAVGEAAIYGPKMDLISKDSLQREWQLSTIQLDLIMPERFGLKYIDADGKEKTPVMIHRAIVGSPERFFGILIEHYAGAFPTWLAPVQVEIIPVGKDHKEYCEKLFKELKSEGIRVEADLENNTVGYKIRNAEKMKVPYMLVIGDKEMGGKDLAVRVRGKKETENIPRDKFIAIIKEEIRERR